ncbi:MAG: thiamine-phosphate pyrophosphorylase [Candidatus Synechococcus spongiarum SP3]|uniref:Thiamine-phosphate synthase n=1 Tax=Candidatus Synechococcus spongiarum SP3 TaxID=1604020 RepID=A0A0G2J4R8_9SYNE|nr:MAG: thiamine-phosphate pyrophosphorylase [Candidatus Synechococcus spongiarum SP3]
MADSASRVVISPPADDQHGIARLLDANLNRAREGLRVVEDWCRLALQRPELVVRLKDYRQRLGQCHSSTLKQARHAASDPATGLAHQAQQERSTPQQVVAANCARVQEALRVLEEFGRHGGPVELAATAATIRYGLYDLETALLANQERHQTLLQARLYLVTQPAPELLAVVKACLEAGLRLVQYREKPSRSHAGEMTDRQRLRTATALRQLCWDHGALFIVNDRVDLALAVEADGVHLGQEDLPPLAARHLLGPERLVGRSTNCAEHLRQAVADGCDYVGVGPVHATPTKPGRPPVGLDYVRQATACSPVPCFAIGGVNLENAHQAMGSGAHGIAVVRALMSASDPGAVTRQLLQVVAASPLPCP